MRLLFAVLIGGLLSFGVSACADSSTTKPGSSVAVSGSISSGAPAGTAAAGGFGRETNDAEEDRSHKDSDDTQVLDFGQTASVWETSAVRALVKRYYEAAAAGDGATGCLLFDSILAKTVVEDYGRPPGPPSLRGKTCAAVVSKLYRQRHRQLVDESSKLHVTVVRVKGDQGLALLNFGGAPERYIPIRRENGAWKIAVFFVIGMP